MRTHLAFSDSPLTQGEVVHTLCGADLGMAQALPIWDEQPVMTNISLPVGICAKCAKAMFRSHGRYAYAVAENFL